MKLHKFGKVMRNLYSKLSLLLGIALLALISNSMPVFADNLPAAWIVCDKSEDCTYVENNETCARAAVNKKYTAEANKYISMKDGGGPQLGIGNSTHCLNHPEAFCTAHACQLAIAPE